MHKFKFTQNAVLHWMVITAAVVAVVTLIIQGFRLPWSEEGALFALYGAGVGFTVAILSSMALLWLIKNNNR